MTETNHPFTLFHVFTGPRAMGNPAMVTIVDELPQSDHALSEYTNVYVQPITNNLFGIRWFKNFYAIQRCGHGTLAATALLANIYPYQAFKFQSDKEMLNVSREQNLYSLSIPEENLEEAPVAQVPFHCKRLSYTPDAEGYLIAELKDEKSVRHFKLDSPTIQSLNKRVLIISARSDNTLSSDLIFRYFAPQYGTLEDIATGSAASILWPFWKKATGFKTQRSITCHQASTQGGNLIMTNRNNKLVVQGEVKRVPTTRNNR